jgi:DNA-binding MarR family transcriptional regulator
MASQLFTTRLQKLLDEFGFTTTQLNLLTHISRWPSEAPAPKIGDLASAVDITQPAATKMVAKFEGLGLISFASETSDKRVKQVRITQKGRDYTHKMQMALGPDMQDWFGDWDRDHLLALTALLKRLGTWLDDNRL